ncbi:MAG: hypothetical protein ACTSQ4_07010 [Candidatus Heimdallarchaeaceae archaeon]
MDAVLQAILGSIGFLVICALFTVAVIYMFKYTSNDKKDKKTEG